jgi:flagellar hook assembly protein FlgD
LIENEPDTTLHWVYFDESSAVSAVDHEVKTAPSSFDRVQNYPNPFNNQTIITYDIPYPTFVQLAIYNIQGEVVTTLVKRQESPGLHSIAWNGQHYNGTALSSGIYIIHLQTNAGVRTRKMLMLR